MTAEEFKQEATVLRERMEKVAHSYLNDADEADDAVQDAMIKLWLMHDSLHSPVAPLAAIVMRNLCLDRLRRQHHMVSTANLPDLYDDHPEAEQQLRIERMMTIIDTMPPKAQLILRLRHMEGMEMKEIARIMGTTEAAVRQALSRARHTVRDRYINGNNNNNE